MKKHDAARRSIGGFLENPTAQASEAALVLLAQRGSDAAFEELVRRRQSAIRTFLTRLSGDSALGDDLAQETFVQAWSRIAQLRSPNAFGGWLRQIAVNTWLRYARRTRIPLDVLDEYDPPSTEDPSTMARRIDLEKAVSMLKPVERLCIVLAYDHGMSHSEIANETSLPLGTIKSHLARALDRLRTWLERDTVGLSRSIR